MGKLWNQFVSEESGQGMVEYGLVVALVAIGLITILGTMKTSLNDIFEKISDTLDGAITP
ncbi:Flp family type IVb pilin [Petroclostridium sp. X23]|uniref:Flp family type IVb pilin n=1 Tax=Petroclostridium sp. X23 TaxID=3045146 RepID=UPI0024ACD4E5|nr:Flp family type IVb pilin [Petroclostridium sp. X23]WHH57937.1 Flp family type IVb pilin [Petroclostridium sp. X23]